MYTHARPRYPTSDHAIRHVIGDHAWARELSVMNDLRSAIWSVGRWHHYALTTTAHRPSCELFLSWGEEAWEDVDGGVLRNPAGEGLPANVPVPAHR